MKWTFCKFFPHRASCLALWCSTPAETTPIVDASRAHRLSLCTAQEEIDRLTKRAKHSESAFLELYPKLFEAPDPAPSLALAFETASRVADLEAQSRKLSQELSEYREESTHIRNQELTVRRWAGGPREGDDSRALGAATRRGRREREGRGRTFGSQPCPLKLCRLKLF